MPAEDITYFERLAHDQARLQPAIENLMAECHTLPVGSGFIDIITRHEHVDRFLDGLTAIDVVVKMITLWCDCTPENERRYGCPHGHGGPRYDAGWYSELCEYGRYSIDDIWIPEGLTYRPGFSLAATANAFARAYVHDGIKRRAEYSPCLVPGFWLAVPPEWARVSYQPVGR